MRISSRSRAPSEAGGSGPSPGAAAARLVAVVTAAAGLVILFDRVLTARVHAGTDAALRLSVILPYLGVDPSYVAARSFGLAALVLSAASVAVGLEAGRRRSLGRAATPALSSLHRQLSLVSIALVVGHLTVPYTSAVAPYGGWVTALVPFAQPFSWGRGAMVAQSLGILSLYLMVVVGPTYWLLRRLPGGGASPGAPLRVWAAVHRLAIAVYGLAVAHAFLLGSDFFAAGPPRVALLAAQIPVTALLARRLDAAGRSAGRALPRVGAAVSAGLAVALAVAVGLGAAGNRLGGFPL
ncbi:MAG TPA: hypothetical protein VFH45_03370 [Acidimicrobiales bacterium]|nr:hypothetical protein [Acidimicrobiales bacterium]